MLDIEIFGGCQALLNNFEQLMCETFGDKYALSASLAFALQFGRSVSPAQQTAMRGASKHICSQFESLSRNSVSTLSADVLADQNYSFKVFLIPKIGNTRSADDVAVEFIKHDPTKSEEMSR